MIWFVAANSFGIVLLSVAIIIHMKWHSKQYAAQTIQSGREGVRN
jgi:hypothetical protein